VPGGWLLDAAQPRQVAVGAGEPGPDRRTALISRSRSGKWRASHLEAASLRAAADWIERYRRFWDSSLTKRSASWTPP
jgi:hypothetical protein